MKFTVQIFKLYPLLDPRWTRFVYRHTRASIFHTREWLEALHRTYGYEPIVYTTSAPSEELVNGMVFCRIESWLTGKRLVSLPFSDHCEPLVDSKEELVFLIASAIEATRWEGYKYVEIRPALNHQLKITTGPVAQHKSFYLHTVDLRPTAQEIFRSFHRSEQQKIRRAERQHLTWKEGRSPELLYQFYRLLTGTRRRLGIPPQPLGWFENLVDCLDSLLTIRVAYKDGRPIASILTLSFKQCVYDKHGCSDEQFHNLGGVPLLLWQTIQEEKERGAQILDLGRSDMEHTSLASFKDHWGSTRSMLHYYRYPPADDRHRMRKWSAGVARYAFARLPDSLLTAAGRILYPHIG